MVNKNRMLRKQDVLLTNEIKNSKKHANELTSINNELNARILDLTTCLEKFTKGQKCLYLLLGSQRCIYVYKSKGHTKYACYVKTCVRKGLKTMQVHKKTATNAIGPNKIWVPKTNV